MMLDPKFAKVIALWRSTTHSGERNAARERAEAIAAAAGMTFEEAVASLDAPAARPSPFAGFDDFMEREEPGWKARRTAEQNERRLSRLAKRAAIIEKYGSVDAALAPCERERLILAAVARWRKPRPAPHQRWTDNLDGWSGDSFERDKMPAHVLAAISAAYPIPSTFPGARAEHDHWRMRDDELDLVLDKSGFGLGDTRLDVAAGVRAEIVRDLVEKDLPVSTIEDLHARFAIYRDLESHDDDVEEALFRDLTAMVERRHLSAQPSSRRADERGAHIVRTLGGEHPSATDQLGRIRAELSADASRSDRSIARDLGCSPTSVGKTRRSMGLAGTPRSVHRRGQTFKMHFGDAQ